MRVNKWFSRKQSAIKLQECQCREIAYNDLAVRKIKTAYYTCKIAKLCVLIIIIAQ